MHVVRAMIFAALIVGHPVSAAPNEDKEVIWQHFLSDTSLPRLRRNFASLYLTQLKPFLLENSIRVLDRQRFAKLLPDGLTDGWVANFKTSVFEVCFEHHSAADLRDIATHIRRSQDKDVLPNGGSQSEIMADLQSCSMLGQFQYFDHLLQRIRRGDEPLDLRNAAGLADVLEAEGVAKFPNRIVRKDILRDLRQAADN